MKYWENLWVQILKIFFCKNADSFNNKTFLAYSELPAFLVQDGGLNSGFMIAHCTAAALGNLLFQHYDKEIVYKMIR